MSSISLVSWEKTTVKLPAEFSEKSVFIKHCPDLDDEIRLKELEIDTETLKIISKFTQIKDSIPDLVSPITAENSFIAQNPNFEQFFESISLEELHLLVLAAYKLDFKDLQKICSYRIAQIFMEMSRDEIDKELDIDELTVDEEDYMKFIWTKKVNSSNR